MLARCKTSLESGYKCANLYFNSPHLKSSKDRFVDPVLMLKLNRSFINTFALICYLTIWIFTEHIYADVML